MRMALWTTVVTMALAGAAFGADATSSTGSTPSPTPVRAAPGSNARWALGQNITQIQADGIAISKVVDYLRNISGANIVVNWKVLEAAGVSQDSPITIDARGVTLRKALQLVLDQASPTVPLTFDVDENVISITTQEDADRVMITKVYIVDDLVMPDYQQNIQVPTFNLQAVTQGGSTQGGGGGSTAGQQSLFSSNNTGAGSQASQTSDQKGQELVELIKEVVRPSIWKDNGGTATMRYFSGKLIVTAPQSVQEMIGGPVNSSTGAIRVGM
ncbi:MAG TPA: hypothetical protein VHQ47_20185 [Phycisphaerae bacterium]|jgi:hypothetical protein|nr:hypothetical protein [Phycisphaerae bacterium]